MLLSKHYTRKEAVWQSNVKQTIKLQDQGFRSKNVRDIVINAVTATLHDNSPEDN
jgi:hypothetical protein